MNSSTIQCEDSPAVAPAAADATPFPASRFERFFDTFFRYAGAVAVDHTHLLPLDRVSGRTGIVRARPSSRGCY